MSGPNSEIVMRETGRRANNRIEAMRRYSEGVEEEREELQRRLAEERQNHAMTTADISEFSDINSRLQRDLESATTDLESKEEELDELQETRERLERELNERPLNERTENIRQDLSDVTNDIRTMTMAVDAANDTIIGISDQMQTMDDYIADSTEEELGEIQSQINRLQRRINELPRATARGGKRKSKKSRKSRKSHQKSRKSKKSRKSRKSHKKSRKSHQKSRKSRK